MSYSLTLDQVFALRLRGGSLTLEEFHHVRNVARRVEGQWVPYAFTEAGHLIEMKYVKDDFEFRLVKVVKGHLPELPQPLEQWGLWSSKTNRWVTAPGKNPPEVLKFISSAEAEAFKAGHPEMESTIFSKKFPPMSSVPPHDKWGIWSDVDQNWALLPYNNGFHVRTFCSYEEASEWHEKNNPQPTSYFPKVFNEAVEKPKTASESQPSTKKEEWGIWIEADKTWMSIPQTDPYNYYRWDNQVEAEKFLDVGTYYPTTGVHARRVGTESQADPESLASGTPNSQVP